jgi:hypothetical protein
MDGEHSLFLSSGFHNPATAHLSTFTYHLQGAERQFPRSSGCIHGCALRASIIDRAAYSSIPVAEIESICIPSSIEDISDQCFLDCSALSTVVFEFGAKLSTLGSRAFGYCESLQSIYLPSLVREIRYGCFTHCACLSSVTFERGSQISILGSWGFEGCSSLRSIRLPSSIERISLNRGKPNSMQTVKKFRSYIA